MFTENIHSKSSVSSAYFGWATGYLHVDTVPSEAAAMPFLALSGSKGLGTLDLFLAPLCRNGNHTCMPSSKERIPQRMRNLQISHVYKRHPWT